MIILDLLGGVDTVVFATPATGSRVGRDDVRDVPGFGHQRYAIRINAAIVQFFDDNQTFVAAEIGIDYLINNLDSIASYSFRKDRKRRLALSSYGGCWVDRAVLG